MLKRKVVISLGNGRGNYGLALGRLAKSITDNWNGDVLFFTDEAQIGAPRHEDNPYAFKVYAFKEALRRGYTQVLWLDSSVYAVKAIQPLFDLLQQDGYVMQEAGHMVGSWCNDAALDYFGITRSDALSMPMYGNAGLLGLDFTFSIANTFFKQWEASMRAGMFKGSWADHRHDMTCGSIIANQLNMNYQPGDTLLQYAAPIDKPINDSIIFYAQGL